MEQDIDTQIDTTDASDVHENASSPLCASANGTSSRPGNQQAACVSEDEVYVRQRNKLKARLEQAARKIRRRHKERLRDARDARDRSQRAADKQFEVDNQRLSEAFSCRAEICALQRQAVEELRAELSLVVQDSPGVFSSVEKSPAMEDETSPPRRRFAKSIRQARRELANVRGYLRFRAKLRAASIGAFLALAVLFGVTAGLLLQWSGWIWISSAALSGPVAALAVGYALIVRPSHKKGQRAYQNCCEAVSAAQAAVDALYASPQTERKQGESSRAKAKTRC